MSDSNRPRIQINYMARISRGDISKFSKVFNMGKIRADTYCPTKEECLEIIDKDLDKYLPFLLWIDQTGFSTPENEENREYLRSYLYSKMLITY